MLHSAVGDVFEGIEFPVVAGDFLCRFPSGSIRRIQSAGIVECSSIDRKMVVVKASSSGAPWCQSTRHHRFS